MRQTTHQGAGAAARLPLSLWLEVSILLGILALAAALRLFNVADNPGWYADEGTQLAIARGLLAGQVRYFAVQDSVLIFGRPPLFGLLLAGIGRVADLNMATLRGLTGGLGVFTVGVLYGFTRALARDRLLALLAAGALAILPGAVTYSRFGFSYNLLPPLVLLALYGLARYLDRAHDSRRGLWLAAGVVGVGLLGEVLILTVAAVVLLIVLLRHWPDALPAGLIMALPGAGYAGLMLLSAPDAFLFDVGFTLSRLSTPLLDQIGNLADALLRLLADPWLLAGVIGLFLLRPRRVGGLALALSLGPALLMGRTVALHSLSFYYLIPVLPLFALGLAALVRHGAPHVYATARDGLAALPVGARPARVGGALAVALLIGVPLLTSTLTLWRGVQNGLPTAIDPFWLAAEDARAVAAFVNAQAGPDDVVIASPALGWQLDAQAADFQMTVAASGEATPHLPANLPAARWAFDPGLSGARYVIVDPVWRNWGAVHIPGVLAMLQAVETWPVAYEAGALVVYANPAVAIR